jgi:hypothetical protein
MYLHSSKYDWYCVPTTITLANTIVPANMIILANTVIPRSSSNNRSNNDCSNEHIKVTIEAQFKR